jgi:hypothetical protein
MPPDPALACRIAPYATSLHHAEHCDRFHEPIAFQLAQNVVHGLRRPGPGVGDLPDGCRNRSTIEAPNVFGKSTLAS